VLKQGDAWMRFTDKKSKALLPLAVGYISKNKKRKREIFYSLRFLRLLKKNSSPSIIATGMAIVANSGTL